MLDFDKPIYSSLATDPDFADLVHDFVNAIPAKCKMIEQHIAMGELNHLQRIVHQLRGACGGYGFPILTEAASVIDESFKAGSTIEGVKPRLEEFLALLKRASSQPKQS